ncbi:Uncharacterised protein [Vibrio cholerae]|uniref:Uncharacterized protein n=1 Tax=Vibrio cholerae TaxID=666 RepID=A0A655YHF4_VIBCL|nr:Uncharacterised protein [Vibrio cholerae]CSA76028.1 Uncharacterised protein [Vibrio cholerae]CSA84052.1 Uncharacterised protein [Vibrio cholerae]CSA89840.1 Uncharacterised protein [Vibrio cholerae]CSA93077.1 Uncharacterised protein [Vibrio cholerae]
MRKIKWCGLDDATQFTKRNNRTSKGHGTDKNTEKYFNQVDHMFRVGSGLRGINVAVKTYQYRGHTHKAVQYCNQLWHFRHFHFLCVMNTNTATDHHSQ